MKETWRWFGPDDPISIKEVRQTGATGIVSALHQIPAGQMWEIPQIQHRKEQIERLDGQGNALSWDVVESLPVSDAIKSWSGPVEEHLAAYKASLRNLAACGLRTVCYNFMPVLDWTRTDLAFPLSNGGLALRFDLVDFIGFDCFLLRRTRAEEDYPASLVDQAHERIAGLGSQDCDRLTQTIVAGLPGANATWKLDDVQRQLDLFAGTSRDRLRFNLAQFLCEVVPVAEQCGISLCCHPDDPPFPLLGLPRVMSTQSDYEWLVKAVDSPSNGITLCTGSLGVLPSFDPVSFVRELGHRIHFVHLRNTTREGPDDGQRASFHEADHLAGDTDMVATLRALAREEARRAETGRADVDIPMRPDHGHVLLSDFDRRTQPGYPLIGRLKGLSELRGVLAAVSQRGGHAE